MYEKGESEFFFLTHFTEYDVSVKNCFNSDNKCLNKTNKEFFTIGVEGMLLAFDHFYTTTFQQGSNLGNSGLKLVDTKIKKPIKILWASPREVLNIVHANQINCDIITVTKTILDKLKLFNKNLDEYSLETVKMFYNDAQKSGFKI